jgi:hypothetical protein
MRKEKEEEIYGYFRQGDATAQTINVSMLSTKKYLRNGRQLSDSCLPDLYSYGYYLWENHDRWIHILIARTVR